MHERLTVHLPKSGRLVRLGRVRPKSPPQALRLRNYLRAGAATPPAKVDYHTKAAAALARMYLNDQYGCCVIAGKAHQAGLWSANDGAAAVIATDDEIKKIYFFFSPNDEGCVITDVLDYFKAHGLVLGGQTHTIDGYVAVDHTNKAEVQTAIDLFGGLTLGLNLPAEWANDAAPGAVWGPTRSGVVGGHDVCAVGYDEVGVQVATWGMVLTIAWAAFQDRRWVEECYAELAPDWYGGDKLAPCGVDAATLAADLAKLGGGGIPPLPDPTPPTPVTPPVVPPAPVVPPGWWMQLLAFVQWLVSLLHPSHRTAEVCAAFEANGIESGAINDWIGRLIQALVAKAPQLASIVVADLAAGKPWAAILFDVLGAMKRQELEAGYSWDGCRGVSFAPYAGPARPRLVAGATYGLVEGATGVSVDWQGVLAWIESLLRQYGPAIVPQIQAWIDGLKVGPFIKAALHALVDLLAKQVLQAQAA